jgi:hypothetical protein
VKDRAPTWTLQASGLMCSLTQPWDSTASSISFMVTSILAMVSMVLIEFCGEY